MLWGFLSGSGDDGWKYYSNGSDQYETCTQVQAQAMHMSQADLLSSALRLQLATHTHTSWPHDQDCLMDFLDRDPAKRTVFTPSLIRELFLTDRQGLHGLQAYFEFQTEIMCVAEGDAETAVKPLDTAAVPASGPALPIATQRLLRLCTLAAGEPNTALPLQRVHDMAAHVQRQLVAASVAAAAEGRTEDATCTQAHTLRCLNTVLFDHYRMAGAQGRRLYHPKSSSLLAVMQERIGGPTALGVVYLAVAELLGLSPVGISLPSHFLVRLKVDGRDVYVDPHGGGRQLSLPEIGDMLAQKLDLPDHALSPAGTWNPQGTTALPTPNTPASPAATPDASTPVLPECDAPVASGALARGPAAGGEAPWFAAFLRPATTEDIVLRLLRNLRDAYWAPLQRRQITAQVGTRQQEWHFNQALSVLRFMRLLQPWHEGHAVDTAMCMFLGPFNRRGEALDVLHAFLRVNPHSREVARALFWMESEDCALQQVARMQRETLERLAREKKRLVRDLPDDKISKTFGPDFYSRAYGRLWDDNFWISALLDNCVEDDDPKGKGSGKGKGGSGGGGKKGK